MWASGATSPRSTSLPVSGHLSCTIAMTSPIYASGVIPEHWPRRGSSPAHPALPRAGKAGSRRAFASAGVGNCCVLLPDQPKEVKMHAVVVRVMISDREAAQQRLDQDVVPQV